MAKARRGEITMPEENRVFDVTRPSHVNPSATSKPVIVGHQPTMSDPMVKDQGGLGSEPTRIPINVSPSLESGTMSEPPVENTSSDILESPAPAPAPEPAAQSFEPPAAFSAPSQFSTPTPTPPQPETALPSVDVTPQPHIEELHFAEPKRRRKWPMFVLVLLALLVGAYLAIDSGLINSSVKLPHHFFKQKSASSTPPASSATSSNTPSAPATPAGFNKYKISGTSIEFAAPATWGAPTSTPDPGYSKRGGTNLSDGTHAYLVDFATNKGVEIAVTSSKYLPATRTTPLYYDYLQWCVGTNDGQIYESVLHFSTANKIDTPTTITCDQGPVPGASKLDSTTAVQTKAQDTAGKVIGDIYIKNLTDPSLVAFRVKDTTMTNGDNIKQLLDTIQITSASQ
jgi:hypothetical protein